MTELPGLPHVNAQTACAGIHVPFGGMRSSGPDLPDQGRAEMEFATETVTVHVDP